MNRYLVWCPEHGGTLADSSHLFESLDHQAAAEQWARYEDRHSADYLIVGEKWTPTVHVCGEHDDEADALIFTVTGYTVAAYTATAKKEASPC